MQLARIEAELGERLDALRRSSSAPLSKAEILAALSEVFAKAGDGAAAPSNLSGEIRSIADFIAVTRKDIAALNPDEIRDRFIPTATDELDAVVSATEAATDTIMACAERIEHVAASLDGEAAASLGNAATEIYEACSFQDITGQRIGKVVQALKEIETRVRGLLDVVGHDGSGAAPREPASEHHDEADLLNGPQLPENANDQDEIDKLFTGKG